VVFEAINSRRLGSGDRGASPVNLQAGRRVVNAFNRYQPENSWAEDRVA
jgi:hypothetical protein